jgi:hypothetical protein
MQIERESEAVVLRQNKAKRGPRTHVLGDFAFLKTECTVPQALGQKGKAFFPEMVFSFHLCGLN